MASQFFQGGSTKDDNILLDTKRKIFTIQGDAGGARVSFDLKRVDAKDKNVNEIGIFVVDDAQGRINNLLPGQKGYLQAALNPERQQAIFSGISNTNKLSKKIREKLTRQLNFADGTLLGFYLVRNDTTDNVRSRLPAKQTPHNVLLAVGKRANRVVKVTDSGDKQFVLSFKDTLKNGNRRATGIVIRAKIATESPELGTRLQGQSELIDLRNLTNAVQASFELSTESKFRNRVGFYVIDDVSGGIDRDGDGTIDLRPSDAGYAAAALRRSIVSVDSTGTDPIQLAGGKLLAPYLITNGTVKKFLKENPRNSIDKEPNKPIAYFAFRKANPDKIDHIRLLGDNTFGFEDLAGGGDKDFNDVVFSVELQQQVIPETALPGGVPIPTEPPSQDIFPTTPTTIPTTRIVPALTGLEAEFGIFQNGGGNPGNFQPTNPLLQVSNGRIIIDIVSLGDPNTLLPGLQALGLQNSAVFGSVISGSLPIGAISQVETLSGVVFVQPTIAPLSNAGFVDNQADVVLNSNSVRQPFPFGFGVDGTGITIGVISDSFNNLGRANLDFATGDLPTGKVGVLQDLPGGGSDEGRAMMQLIHDIAPGATLLFNTAFGGEAVFANAILNLANAGADIIVDDVSYPAEPMFQNGLIAQAVNQVVRGGVSYFTSAANNGRNAYESLGLNPGLLYGAVVHDFNSGPLFDPYQSITVPVGATITIVLQWDQPFRSLNPLGSGSQNDLNIYLTDRSGQFLPNSSQYIAGKENNLGRDPVEILQFSNDGSRGTEFNVVIQARSGFLPGYMKYVIFKGPNPAINEYNSQNPFTGSPSGTVYGHANSPFAEAVGASPFYDPLQLENFSSGGSTPLFFDDFGNPFFGDPGLPRTGVTFDSFGNRLVVTTGQPRIVAPNNTNTTFFGQDIPQDLDLFPNFSGTSAAAPHAAAVAALMMQANPNLIGNPATVYGILESTAIDMDDPATPFFDFGPDFASGFGLINAFSAVNAATSGFATFG